jgi:predicted GNAT family N-acyltransferase
VYVKDFYAAHGYVERGEEFLEADIVHILMRKEAAN